MRLWLIGLQGFGIGGSICVVYLSYRIWRGTKKILAEAKDLNRRSMELNEGASQALDKASKLNSAIAINPVGVCVVCKTYKHLVCRDCDPPPDKSQKFRSIDDI